MAGRLVLLDTSFLLALENRDDPLHDRAKALAREFATASWTLVLHWGILLEIGDGYARIDRRTKGATLLERLQNEDNFRVIPLTADIFQESIALYRGRSDKGWGLTDCISFVLMQRYAISDALTADIHFRQAGFRALLLE